MLFQLCTVFSKEMLQFFAYINIINMISIISYASTCRNFAIGHSNNPLNSIDMIICTLLNGTVCIRPWAHYMLA